MPAKKCCVPYNQNRHFIVRSSSSMNVPANLKVPPIHGPNESDSEIHPTSVDMNGDDTQINMEGVDFVDSGPPSTQCVSNSHKMCLIVVILLVLALLTGAYITTHLHLY